MTHFHRCAIVGVLSVVIGAVAAVAGYAMPIGKEGKPAATIVVAVGAIAAEQTAAQELADYLEKVVGGKFAVVGEAEAKKEGPFIFAGPTAVAKQNGLDPSGWGPERWAIRSVDGDLVLVGGRPRGTLYAVYRFLEDVVGVHWWNPYEEHVPKRPRLEVGALDLQGAPRFHYRDIYLLYANDDGRFAARNRINGLGFTPNAAKYGGGVYYGPPNGVHTFYFYISPTEHFEKHPEWFSLLHGKRTADKSQLCLTNAEMRAAVIEKLKGFIEQSRAAAAQTGQAPPLDFDISQNDWDGMCQCANCQTIFDREGSQSGPLLDFLNAVADAVREKYQEVRINTLAYQMTENPPKTIRPRDNILIRLCDTNANLLRPITHADNKPFADRLAAWSQICKTLRIWDYAVTYTVPQGLPLPTVDTYPIDYRYFVEHNVEGVFTEHEFPLTADLRDLKVWMMMKLLEDPYRDYDGLLRDFCDGFYGPAGSIIRRYLSDLQAAAVSGYVNWFPVLSQFNYLTLGFLGKAQATFDEAEKVVADDAVLLRRVRHARLPVDRACLVLWRNLVTEWMAQEGRPETMPLAREGIAARCRETWNVQIDLRFPESQRAAQKAEVEKELTPLLTRPAYVPVPTKFKEVPQVDLLDFTAETARNHNDMAKRVADREAESGFTNRLELSNADMERYKLPMPWGMYDQTGKRHMGSTKIKPEDVPGPGYHWYKLGTFQPTPSAYVWFFWSWVIQFPAAADPQHAEQQYEVWASIKFEGPGFPHGTADQKNAICVERVVQVKTKQ